MAKRPRRNHSSTFKAKVALAAIKGDKTLVELSEQFDVHANQITQWKSQLLERASDAFDGTGLKEPPVDVKTYLFTAPWWTKFGTCFGYPSIPI